VLVHKHIVAAVHALFEEWEEDQPNSSGADANRPQNGVATDIF
jgi:hypothetical protein